MVILWFVNVGKENTIGTFNDLTGNRKKENKNNATLIVRNKNSILQLVNWLYDDSTIYQDIKYNKYLKIKHTLTNSNDYPKGVEVG